MIRQLSLQNFRNYSERSFSFDGNTTLIVGPNATGKTNILEAIYVLAMGKSFRAETETELVRYGERIGRIVGKLAGSELEIIWDDRGRFQKLYRVNGVGKRMVDFVGNLRVVLFSPSDIEIVADSPATRRSYLDSVLSLVHRDYRQAIMVYERALRQRNKLLSRIREERLSISGYRGQLNFWDGLLTVHGSIIHERRKEYLGFLNELKEEFFPIRLDYEHSIVSPERLERYRGEEIGAGMTLVGPHRDDFAVNSKLARDLRAYGSRGEQRMAVFTMKLGELEYVSFVTGERPVLLLDDIFSELDHTNRHRLLSVIPKQQTIITTTDLHVVEKSYLKKVKIVGL